MKTYSAEAERCVISSSVTLKKLSTCGAQNRQWYTKGICIKTKQNRTNKKVIYITKKKKKKFFGSRASVTMPDTEIQNRLP